MSKTFVFYSDHRDGYKVGVRFLKPYVAGVYMQDKNPEAAIFSYHKIFVPVE